MAAPAQGFNQLQTPARFAPHLQAVALTARQHIGAHMTDGGQKRYLWSDLATAVDRHSRDRRLANCGIGWRRAARVAKLPILKVR